VSAFVTVVIVRYRDVAVSSGMMSTRSIKNPSIILVYNSN